MDVEESMLKDTPTKKSGKKLAVIAVLCCVACLILGILIGYFSTKRTTPGIEEGTDLHITQNIIDSISSDNIRDNLRKWTQHPHLAGTERSFKLADDVAEIWRNQGIENVELKKYEVLLSYPNINDPNKIYLLDEDDNKIFESASHEDVFTPEQNYWQVIPPYNAFSPAGDVIGSLVYIRYCRSEDFDKVLALGITLTGHIAMCRYGKIFRGDKVKFASEHGMIGVILYSDPADYAPEGPDKVFPDAWWLPPTGVQRGNVYLSDGDPLTPGYPATDTAYRRPISEVDTFVSIPVTPIGYGDAEQLMKNIGGEEAPEDWQGGINMTYRLGPGFLHSDWKVRLDVNTEYRSVNVTNVIGYIHGSVEPDRYVIVGNHRDAWVFGGVDPTSGTAVMVEVARVFAKLLKEGWRPRRTVVFCSWGGEEFGLMGSYEWVEEFVEKLGARTVAYINQDNAVRGNHSLQGRGMPILYSAMYDVAKKIETPNTKGKTLYDEWLEAFPGSDSKTPEISGLGSGSDYAPFKDFAGIPGMYAYYTYDHDKWSIAGHPLYHSASDTFTYVDKYVDPGLKATKAVAQYQGEMIRYLADSLLLPLDVTAYGEALIGCVEEFKTAHGDFLQDNNISLDDLTKSAKEFHETANNFKTNLEKTNKNNPLEVRMYNDQMMQLERYFLLPEGLPGKPYLRHILFAPSSSNAYSGSAFPGLLDLIADIKPNDPQIEHKLKQLKRHLSLIIYTINAAAASLHPARHI